MNSADPASTSSFLQLGEYRNTGYTPGASLVCRVLWYVVNEAVFRTGWFPFSALKRALLRLFGATIGPGVVIKPHVNIKFPWRLAVGEQSWIGEEAWIDNLDRVSIGQNCCVSQGVYLCTGGHDPRQPSFPLVTRPIVIRDGVWVGARALVLGGVTIENNAVVAAGTTVNKNVAGNDLVVGAAGVSKGPVRP